MCDLVYKIYRVMWLRSNYWLTPMLVSPSFSNTALPSHVGNSEVPIVSVITVVKNGVASIAETIESVRNQVTVSFEHIIVDGASTDGTQRIISSLQHDRLRCMSGKDFGIYDAMNKGLAVARGEWIIFLGADDIFVDKLVLSDVFQDKNFQQYVIIAGRSVYSNGQVCNPYLNWRTLVFNTLHHQAAFYSRQLFSNFRYRNDIPVIADYELNLFIYLHKLPVKFLDRQIAASGILGVSKTSSMISNWVDAFKIRRSYVSLLTNVFLSILGIISLILFKFKLFWSHLKFCKPS